MSGVNGTNRGADPTVPDLTAAARNAADWSTSQLGWVVVDNQGHVFADTFGRGEEETQSAWRAYMLKHPIVDVRRQFSIQPVILVEARHPRMPADAAQAIRDTMMFVITGLEEFIGGLRKIRDQADGSSRHSEEAPP